MKQTIKATRPEMASYEEYVDEIRSVWDTGAMTNNGPKVQLFAEKLRAYTNCPNVELFVNGHASLAAAIKAMELPQGTEVLTSPFTFVSTPNAIEQCGLTPVFCDIDDTYNIDIDSIRRNITSRTSAIVTPHIFGIPCHVKEIESIAKEYGIKVIYDGAQAFGTKINGRNIAEFGDAVMFSFHAIKVFNAIEGGALAYRDAGLKAKLELYRNFGISYGATNDVEVSGFNAKMTEFSAAMGLVNLPHVEETIARRKQLARHYREVFEEIPGVETYRYEESIDYNYAYFPVVIDAGKTGMTRDEIWFALKENGVETRKLYDVLTCDYSFYKSKPYKRDIRYAREMTEKCLDFPMYSSLREEDVDYIGEVLKKEFGKKCF